MSGRATRVEMATRDAAFVRLAAQHGPASVRHLFYRAVVEEVPGITKDGRGYEKAQRAVLRLRRQGAIAYEEIVDLTRWQRKAASYGGIEEVLRETARFYRRDLWARSPYRIEVWCESDSIAGVIYETTHRWDVPLMSTRGYSSATFAYSAAVAWLQDDRKPVVLYVGDHDPHGLEIESALRSELELHYGGAIYFERMGVTWGQVEDWDLPGTKPKKPYGFPLAVEAEAIPPGDMRLLVDEAVADFADTEQLAVLHAAEESERAVLMRMAETAS